MARKSKKKGRGGRGQEEDPSTSNRVPNVAANHESAITTNAEEWTTTVSENGSETPAAEPARNPNADVGHGSGADRTDTVHAQTSKGKEGDAVFTGASRSMSASSDREAQLSMYLGSLFCS